MSARDAVYLIEKTGMHVIIRGVGTVTKQTVLKSASKFTGH
jgi:hypothetical protein